MDSFKKIVGLLIRNARKNKGLTQEELAEGIGSEGATIGRYERGEFAPSLEQLAKISDFLSVSPAELIPTRGDREKERLKELRKELSEKSLQIDSPSHLKELIQHADALIPSKRSSTEG
ncbi:helix-turn-helix domain-containing protein [Xylophilus sp.]|uniref:helix-turn-helix domain-containing protein n=1 Tax=Xylophilus sp. TaxID=2653893 RepID=UPI002D8035A4|nr:helix-turn-helix transcriptional regulator [Xylophilus sp.]